VQAHSLQALLASYDIWKTLPNALRNRNPTGYPHFDISLSRVSLYINSMKRNENWWIGLKFNYPLIWCSTQQYKARFHWNNMEEIALWRQVDRNLGFFHETTFGHSTYNFIMYTWEFHRKNNIVHEVMQNSRKGGMMGL
jgi:hypothetical protein